MDTRKKRGQRRKGRSRAWVLWTVVLLPALGMVGCGSLMMLLHGHPMEFETGPRPEAQEEYGFGPRTSRTGLYRVSAEPLQPIRVGRIHAMKLRVETADGRPVQAVSLLVDGGMPEHGHGLPTRPEVTAELGEGVYALEGMKYNMGGWWVVRVRIVGSAGADEVLFNLNL